MSSPSTSSTPSSLPRCGVCDDLSSGFHCGAFVCEACKKFFVRSMHLKSKFKAECVQNGKCEITKTTRTQCPQCRFNKCISLNMYGPGSRNVSEEINHIPCKVCGAPSSGFHFGAITCEGCKGFYRRYLKDGMLEKLECFNDMRCDFSQKGRNICKLCRYKKCCDVGMTPEKCRIGRQPNLVKHKTQLEVNQFKRYKNRQNDLDNYLSPADEINNSEHFNKGSLSDVERDGNCFNQLESNDIIPVESEVDMNKIVNNGTLVDEVHDRSYDQLTMNQFDGNILAPNAFVHEHILGFRPPKIDEASNFQERTLQFEDSFKGAALPENMYNSSSMVCLSPMSASTNVLAPSSNWLEKPIQNEKIVNKLPRSSLSLIAHTSSHNILHDVSITTNNEMTMDMTVTNNYMTRTSTSFAKTLQPNSDFNIPQVQGCKDGITCCLNKNITSLSDVHRNSPKMFGVYEFRYLPFDVLSKLLKKPNNGEQNETKCDNQTVNSGLVCPKQQPFQQILQKKQHCYYSTSGLVFHESSFIYNQVIDVMTMLCPVLTSLTETNLEKVYQDSNLQEIWEIQMSKFSSAAKKILKFAKSVPGFKTFSLPVQVDMIQRCMYPVVVMAMTKLYNHESVYFGFTREESKVIINNFFMFEKLAKNLLDTGAICKAINLDYTEIAFICAIYIIDIGNEPMYKELLIDSLETYIKNRYGTHSLRHMNILRFLRVMAISMEVHVDCMNILFNHPQFASLPVPQLFAETFGNLE